MMPDERRRELLLVIFLMPVTAAAEMLMVAAIVPLLSIMGGSVDSLPVFPAILDWTGRIVQGSALFAAATLFVISAFTTALLRLFLTWSTLRFAAKLGHGLNLAIQDKLLHQPFLFHVSSNSSRLLASLDKVDHLVFDLAQRGLQGIGAAIISLAVIAALIRVDPLSAAAAVVLVTLLYGVVLSLIGRRLESRGKLVAHAFDRRIQLVQENLGAIRDIIIDRSQAAHLANFGAVDEQFMLARAETNFLSAAPRFLIEGIGLGLIALVGLYIAARPGGLPAALPVLGALALGAQRLLPLSSQVYAGWIGLLSSKPLLGDVTAILRLPNRSDREPRGELPFRNSISLDQVAFRYPGRTKPAVHDLSLAIPHGARVAIVGKTGSGKSTLADLVMGLIEPTAGQIRVDGRILAGGDLVAWRKSIAHVPQSVFLADASIARNISFASPDDAPDLARVRRAAAIAQLDGFIESLPEGYETRVGERGIRLSGGQRQRLALARAVYKQAPLLVLDEATSALDEETEAAVLSSLDELHANGHTIIIIAHRMSTIERCELIFMLADGELVQAGAYPELFGRLNRMNQQGEL